MGNPVNSRSRAARIRKNIAVFYPNGFKPEDTLPSLALVREFRETGRLPKTWKTKPTFSRQAGKHCAIVKIAKGTSLYGTGEVTGPLERTGQRCVLWNTDNVTYRKAGGKRLYQSHPWVMAVRKDGSAFGVLADSTWRMEIRLRNEIRIVSDGPAFRVIVAEAASPQGLMKQLAILTGKIALPPRWALGFQQCRWSYYPDKRVRQIADGLRKRKIPADVIWMDIHYMDGYRVFTFNPKHFPNPKATNRYLHSKGFKAVWMIDPGVKAQKGYRVYDAGTRKKAWVRTRRGTEFNGKVWPGACAFPDFTRPDVRKWWSGLYRAFMAQGVDGVWNDMNEPAVFGGPDWTMPLDNLHGGDNGLPNGPHARYHNVYGMLMVRASLKGILKANPQKRPFVLTRSNFLGGHRYAATWTGDNGSRWEHLKMSIPMSVTLGLSGQPFNGPDIGGFAENATPELFGHWMAVGAFYPFSRAHTAVDTKAHEPWSFGKEIERVSRTAMERRYRLLPYLYTLFRQSSVDGVPIMRPVFFADPADARLRKEDQAFLVGSDLLVIPKWAKRPKLPKGIWRTVSLVGEDSAKDKYQPDVRIRGGSIVPLGRVIQNTTQESLKPLTLLVCLDENGKAKGTLYEDAGEGYGYQKGKYRLTRFSARKKGSEVEVVIGPAGGNMRSRAKALRVEVITASGVYRAKGRL